MPAAAALPASPLLPTKLFIPVLGADLVERTRLLGTMNDTQRARLVLVSAPAGAGKTTLAAQWVRRVDVPACWVSLDPGDDDPATFLRYIIEAFQSAGRGWCQRTQALVQSGASEPRLIAMSLVAELAATACDGVLVLDDYHVVADPAVHDLFGLLIERAPPSITFVVVTRHDPPLPLARFRARGMLREVRASDLRFDLEEARALTEQLARKPLRPESLAVLAQRTEGWAAGLQLAGLALRQARDPEAFVADFSGAHSFVADYLTDEVLAGMPEPQQRFLLETAPLARLTGPLCDAALERTGSQAVLDELHRANLFLVPLDNERRWYRYHHLFADLLRRRSGDATAAGRRALLARAAAWCEQHGAVDDAILYMVQAHEMTLAADLVARHGIATLAAGAGITVLRWIRLLPDDRVRCSPDHCVIAAWALTLMQVYDPDGDAEDVEVERRAEALAPAPSHDPIGGYARQALEMLEAGSRPFPHVDDVEHHARVLLATADGGSAAALSALEDARDSTPEGNRPLRAVAEVRIGELCGLTGRYERGLAAHDRARDIAVQAGSELLRVSGLTGRALILLLQGRLREVIVTVETEMASRHSLVESLGTYVGNLYALLAAAHLEADDLDATERTLTRAWMAFGAGDDADGWRNVVRFGKARPRAAHLTVQSVLWGFTTQVSLLVRRGDLAAARRHLDEIAASMPPSAGPAERVVLDSLRVRVWAAANERRLLVHWWRHDPPGPTGQACWDHVRVLALGRAALAAGDAGAAREVVAPAIAAAKTGEPDLAFVPALILDGIAAYTSGAGDRTAALDRTMEALLLTAADGRLAPWLAMGQAATPLLEAVVRNGDASAHVLAHSSTVLGLLREDRRGTPAQDPDALSARELTVLRLLAAGHTNQEIADTLFLALGSVKKHTHNIYGKLGVKSRTQAVRAARERRMLD